MKKNWLTVATILAAAAGRAAGASCPPTPVYQACDLVFELNDAEAAAHPNPYVSVAMHAEFRSPRLRTFMMPAFWDGGRRLVIRFTGVEAGDWQFRVSGNIERLSGEQGTITVTDSDTPGFVEPRNMHHWSYTERLTPHLWMGDTCYQCMTVPDETFRRIVDARVTQKFNHIRFLLLGWTESAARVFPAPDRIDPTHFQRVDERIRYMNAKGIVGDVILGADEDHLAKLFPRWQDRERYIRYVVSRYAPFNITWQGVQEFEEYEDGRGLLKRMGELIKAGDPFNHPRSTHTVATSAPLLGDGWMNYLVYQSSDVALGAVERQLFAVPSVNTEFGYEDSGAGRTHAHHVDVDGFRKRLWNASMNGQYPTFGNTGTYGGKKIAPDAKFVDSPGARTMTAWYDFFAETRHWELEPYFDVDGGRAVALEDVEYIVYLENPGPVEVVTTKRSYAVKWVNPATGEVVKEKKDFKGERFAGEPPNRSHDWVLHLEREGHKQSRARSYKFESRRILKQEVETNPKDVPFEIAAPEGDALSMAQAAHFAAKLTRETRASKKMLWLWTVEVHTDQQGFRMLGSGQEGDFRISRGTAKRFPATMHLRLHGLNGVGKLYALDRIYQLTQ